jgi:hypothetical protein
MSDATPTAPTTLPLWQRAVYAVPVIGWLIKDLVHGDADNVYYFIAGLVCLWIIAGLQFGLVGIAIPAVLAAPAILLGLVLLTRG